MQEINSIMIQLNFELVCNVSFVSILLNKPFISCNMNDNASNIDSFFKDSRLGVGWMICHFSIIQVHFAFC